jgi:replicative DNA helicase
MNTYKKILKLALTEKGILDKLINARVTTDHFLDAKDSRESKILSKIFSMSCKYHEESSGSLLTYDVFNKRINESNIKDALKSDVISCWIDVQEQKCNTDDYYQLLQEIKHLHAEKLLDCSLTSLQNNLTEKGLKDSIEEMQAALDEIHGEFSEFSIERTTFNITERADDFAKEYLKRIKNADKFGGIMSGIPSIDEKTMGWFPGQLIVFLGPTAGGKSVQLLNAAVNANRISKKNVLYFSFEMDAWHCELRTLANILNIPYDQLKKQNMSDTELHALFESYKEIRGPYFIYDVNMDDPTPEYIESKIRELASTKGVPEIIIVDYIGNMTTRSSNRNAKYWEHNGDAAVGLFKLSKKYNIPILTAQQVNRDVFRENRKNKEAGKISAYYQDAASGDQRLMHSAYYVIGIEPDRDNDMIIYHPVKMREAYFEPCITGYNHSTYKILPLTEKDHEYWKQIKGLIKENIPTSILDRPTESKSRSFSLDEDESDDVIPW